MGKKAQMQISGRLLSEYFSLPADHPTKCRLVENKCSRKIFLNRNLNYGYVETKITKAKNPSLKNASDDMDEKSISCNWVDLVVGIGLKSAFVGIGLTPNPL